MNDAQSDVSVARRPLRTISEIRSFFRTNVRPIFFVGPTAFNLLGIDRWVRNFGYLVYYDSWDGAHPLVFTPEEQAIRRVREQRADQQLPPAGSRGAGPRRVSGGVLRPSADDRDGVLRRGDRADLRGTGLQPDPPAGLAATAPGLQDRDDSARRGGGGTLGAQCHRTGRQPHRAGQARRRRGSGLRPGRADSVRRLGQDDLLHQGGARLAAQRRAHGRRGAQDHETDQQPGRSRGGRQHPPRHRRGAVHDRL